MGTPMWFCENHCGLDGFASICRTTFLLLLLGMEGEGEGGGGGGRRSLCFLAHIMGLQVSLLQSCVKGSIVGTSVQTRLYSIGLFY
jgi:hypothetical protein